MFSIHEFVRLRYVLKVKLKKKSFKDNPVLAIPFACVKSPYTNRITSPERVPILQSPKNSAKTSPSVKPLTMNLPPIPQLSPAPHHGVSQKHKKGRTLAEMRANIQERRQSVIRYCPPGSAIPTRVIKSLQQVIFLSYYFK